MTAGDLRDLVEWQPPVRTENAGGQKVTTYGTTGTTTTTRANVKPVVSAAGEADKHQQLTPTVSYEVTIRSRTVDVRRDWRAVWTNRGRTLDVAAVLPHPNGGEFVLVLCKERPATTTT